jgi:hypothetical protein
MPPSLPLLLISFRKMFSFISFSIAYLMGLVYSALGALVAMQASFHSPPASSLSLTLFISPPSSLYPAQCLSMLSPVCGTLSAPCRVSARTEPGSEMQAVSGTIQPFYHHPLPTFPPCTSHPSPSLLLASGCRAWRHPWGQLCRKIHLQYLLCDHNHDNNWLRR